MANMHTPGPWEWLYRHASTATDSPSRGLVIGLPWSEDKNGCGYTNANDVRLMAAAPDLLDALRAVYRRANFKDCREVQEQAEAALTKAGIPVWGVPKGSTD